MSHEPQRTLAKLRRQILDAKTHIFKAQDLARHIDNDRLIEQLELTRSWAEAADRCALSLLMMAEELHARDERRAKELRTAAVAVQRKR